MKRKSTTSRLPAVAIMLFSMAVSSNGITTGNWRGHSGPDIARGTSCKCEISEPSGGLSVVSGICDDQIVIWKQTCPITCDSQQLGIAEIVDAPAAPAPGPQRQVAQNGVGGYLVVEKTVGEEEPAQVAVLFRGTCAHGVVLEKEVPVKVLYNSRPGRSGADSENPGSTAQVSIKPPQLEWKVSLGNDASGKNAGDLSISSPGAPGPDLATPGGLGLAVHSPQVDSIFTKSGVGGGDTLRQVLAPECFVQTSTNAAGGYSIDFYTRGSVMTGQEPNIIVSTNFVIGMDANFNTVVETNITYSYDLNPGAVPYTSLEISGTGAGASCHLDISRIVSGSAAGFTRFTWNGESWDRTEGGIRTEQTASMTDMDGNSVKSWMLLDSASAVISSTRKTYAPLGDRWMPVEVLTDPGGLDIATTYEYHSNPHAEHSYGRMSREVSHDGSWAEYEYTTSGLRSQIRYGWLDGTDSTQPHRVELRSFEPFMEPTADNYPPGVPVDTGKTEPGTPRVETTLIGGVPVSKTIRTVAIDTMRYLVVEELHLPDPEETNLVAAWFDPSTPHTIRRYMPESTGRPCSSLPELTIGADGAATHYGYASGYCTNGVDGLPGDFEIVSGGPHFRTVITRGTRGSFGFTPEGLATNGFEGIPGRTTREVVIETRDSKRELQRETHVCSAPGEYARVAWTTTARDELGREVSTRGSDGTRTEKAYVAGRLAYEVSADGIRTDYTHDMLGRTVKTVRKGFSSRPDVTSETVYDAADRVLSITVSSGSLSQTTTNRYDGAGRLVWTRSPDGIETAYEHGFEGVRPYTATIRGYGTALATTNRTVRFVDGQVAYTEFNGPGGGLPVRKTTYAYGVNQDGTRWTKVFEGPPGANSPVWTLTVTDSLGRTIREERPGFDGATLVTENTYNAAGQLLSTTRKSIVDSVPSMLSVVLYSYDTLGEPVLTAQDIDLDGQINFAGTDVVNSNATEYVKLGSDWWRESRQWVFPESGSAAPLLVSTSRQRLSGLGGVEATVIGSAALVSESVSIDHRGNSSTRKSYLNRDARASASVSTSPASTLEAYSISVGGLSLTNRTSTGIVTSREYDALGRIVSTTDGRGNTTAISYDAQGRAAWVEDTFGSRTTYAYDALGRQTAVTDALDHAAYTDYDAEGRVVSTWGATYPVTYAYDDFGRMVGMTTYRDEVMEEGDTTAWVYDAATSLLTSKVYADGNGPSYTYTADGKLATRTWARGITTTYAYDGAGRLSSISYDPDTPDIAYTYDRLGRQLSAASSVSTNLFVYSSLDLVSETQNGTVLDRRFDALGRSSGFNIGDDYVVENGYDQYGRFASVASSGNTYSYSYLAGSDLISGMAASSGHAWTRSYELHRNLIAAVENTYGSTVIFRFDYKNDEIGRRTAIARSGVAFEMLVQDAYGYNARSEVTSARRTLTSDANQEVRGFSYDYTYDPIGNRISATEYDHEDNALVSSYTANELNQYEQRTVPGYAGVRGSATNSATVTVNGNPAWRIGDYFYGGDDADNATSAIMKELETLAVINPPGTNMPDIVQAETGRLFVPKTPEVFTHDDDGNLTQDGRFTYTWDGENRLIAVETRADLPASVPRVKVAYNYDHRSRRIGKVLSNLEGETWTVSECRTFLYDGWNMIREIQHSNIPSFHSSTNSYVWGLDLSGSRQGAGGVGGLLAVVQDGETYRSAFDGNGNVMGYISNDGTIAAHYEYSPFGETVIQSGDMADSFAFRFSTKYWDDEAKLYYYGYRFYVPVTGRWMNRDPLAEFAGLSRYSFLSNNPMGAFDYLGLIDPEKVAAVLSKLLACKATTPDAYNWDDGIEYLLKKAYGKNWKKELVKVAGSVNKGLGAVKYIPEKYEDAKDVLDNLYPEGVPFDTKGLLDADLSKIVEIIADFQTSIDALVLLIESSEDVTGTDAANLLSKVFNFSKSLGGDVPGIGSFLDFYSSAIDIAAKGIKNIEDQLFNYEADIMIESECLCIDEFLGGTHGVVRDLMKQLRKDK